MQLERLHSLSVSLVAMLAMLSVSCTGQSNSASKQDEHGSSGPAITATATGETGLDGTNDSIELGGMVLVPAGSFWRGCDPESGHECEDDDEAFILLNVPFREIELSEFWIDKYEVTVEAYEACGAAGACTAPGDMQWSDISPPDVPNLPVTGVSWLQADTYCKWRNKRLPTEAEWEKAARGTDARRWPWGNEWPACGQAHLLLGEPCERIRHKLPVDEMLGDRSPYGAIGMIGNVQEWVHDWAAQTYYESAPSLDPPGPAQSEAYAQDLKVVRGGYWDSAAPPDNSWVSVFLRRWGSLDKGQSRIGFRCASSEAPP